MFTGEQLTGATKAGSNFIGNEQYIEVITEFAYKPKVFRVVKPHTACALNNRLKYDRRKLTMKLFKPKSKLLTCVVCPFVIRG